YKELGNAGLKAKDVPVVAFSVGEEELRGVDTKPLVGHLAAWNYFMSIKNPANDEFTKKWAAYAKAKNIAGHKDKPLTNDPMEATYIGINMWKQAVEKAKTTDVDKVIAAMAGQTFTAPSGPPLAQVCVHWRNQSRRPVQRGLENTRPRQSQAMEPLHSWQRHQA
ncbi:MAG: Aliphatic amidase expression-regulating protein, partial [Pseudomonadota bacterium]